MPALPCALPNGCQGSDAGEWCGCQPGRVIARTSRQPSLRFFDVGFSPWGLHWRRLALQPLRSCPPAAQQARLAPGNASVPPQTGVRWGRLSLSAAVTAEEAACIRSPQQATGSVSETPLQKQAGAAAHWKRPVTLPPPGNCATAGAGHYTQAESGRSRGSRHRQQRRHQEE
jgi:hypothetical protein